MASQLGVSTNDLECLNLVAGGGDVTAGALATRTGLTTGAITGAIDRLEQAGLVERRKDDTDRRKVIVVEKSATWRAHPSSGLMRKTVAGVLARYDDEQLAFLERALSELAEAGETVLASMRAGEKVDASAQRGGAARPPPVRTRRSRRA
jgi:DNA-binding MarR family transcriptional regulator